MLTLFSADDHIVEHAMVWQDRVPAKHREQAPVGRTFPELKFVFSAGGIGRLPNALEQAGVDRIMWECDYPHTDTVVPESRQSAQEVFDEAGCTPEEVEAISHGNAERVFAWTMAAAELATVSA